MTTVNAWISDNAKKLRQRLNTYNNLDEDAFQDAYLTLVRDYPTPEYGSTLETAFLAAYKQLRNKRHGEVFAKSHCDDVFFALLPSGEAEPMDKTQDSTEDSLPLAKRVQRYIRASFPRRDVMAFEMKIKGFACRDIADTIGLRSAAINSVTQKIISQTRLQFTAVAI